MAEWSIIEQEGGNNTLGKKNWKPLRGYNMVLNIVMLVFVAALLVFVIGLVRMKLLQNAQRLGSALVRSYATEEQMTIEYLEKEVTLVSQYVSGINENGGDTDEIQTWLRGHLSKLIRIMGEDLVDFYAVVDGYYSIFSTE